MQPLKRVITIGVGTNQCDFRIDLSMMSDDMVGIYCQILQLNNNEFQLKLFCDYFTSYIHINGRDISSPAFDKNKIIGNRINLDFDDSIRIGEHNIYWQQWFCGYALNCENCKYYRIRLHPLDKFCDYCRSTDYNPPPLKRGFSNYFRGEYEFFNYSCENCSYLYRPFNDWCVECVWGLSPHPKFNSWKEHIAMYDERIRKHERLE